MGGREEVDPEECGSDLAVSIYEQAYWSLGRSKGCGRIVTGNRGTDGLTPKTKLTNREIVTSLNS